MNKVTPIDKIHSTQPFDQSLSQQSQIGLNKFAQISQTVQVYSKNSVKLPSDKTDILECRICLQTEEQSNEKCIQPCQCTGSVQSVHEKCFTEWIRRSLVSKSNRELNRIAREGIECDLCKMKFQVRFTFQKTCTNMQKFKQKINYRKCQFFTLCFMLTTAIILLILTLILMPTDIFSIDLNDKTEGDMRTKTDGRQGWQKIVLLSSLSVLGTMLVVVSYLLVSEYGFSYRTEFGYKGGQQLKTIKGIVSE